MPALDWFFWNTDLEKKLRGELAERKSELRIDNLPLNFDIMDDKILLDTERLVPVPQGLSKPSRKPKQLVSRTKKLRQAAPRSREIKRTYIPLEDISDDELFARIVAGKPMVVQSVQREDVANFVWSDDEKRVREAIKEVSEQALKVRIENLR